MQTCLNTSATNPPLDSNRIDALLKLVDFAVEQTPSIGLHLLGIPVQYPDNVFGLSNPDGFANEFISDLLGELHGDDEFKVYVLACALTKAFIAGQLASKAPSTEVVH